MYQSQPTSESVVSNASSCSVEKIQKSCSVVPVWLSHASNHNHRKLVYALLDSQSDSSFILDKTLDSFNASSLNVNMSVSTMSGINQQVASRKCSGFKVQGYNTSQIIDLPAVFSRPDIPIDRSHIPKPDSFVDQSHLKDISSRLSYFSDIDIGLLIGFNCPEASVPLEVVLGSDISKPYAVQTPLGWTIIGSTSLPLSKSPLQKSSGGSTGLDSSTPVSVRSKNIERSKASKPTASSSLLTRVVSSTSSSTDLPQFNRRRTPQATLFYYLRHLSHRKFDPCSSIQTVKKLYATREFPAKKPSVVTCV